MDGTGGVLVRDESLGALHTGAGRVEGPSDPLGGRANTGGSEGDVGGSSRGVIGPVKESVEYREISAGAELLVA